MSLARQIVTSKEFVAYLVLTILGRSGPVLVSLLGEVHNRLWCGPAESFVERDPEPCCEDLNP